MQKHNKKLIKIKYTKDKSTMHTTLGSLLTQKNIHGPATKHIKNN